MRVGSLLRVISASSLPLWQSRRSLPCCRRRNQPHCRSPQSISSQLSARHSKSAQSTSPSGWQSPSIYSNAPKVWCNAVIRLAVQQSVPASINAACWSKAEKLQFRQFAVRPARPIKSISVKTREIRSADRKTAIPGIIRIVNQSTNCY